MQKIIPLLAVTLLTCGSFAHFAQAADPSSPAPAVQTAPDNTGRNVRDRSSAARTSGDQSERKADRTLTQRIRQAVVKDKSLSTTAHNIKIITANGVVTLRGPVNSEQERDKIVAKAQQIAGDKQVENHLEVASH
jgi:hyperosmotically inducible periplasmic protein